MGAYIRIPYSKCVQGGDAQTLEIALQGSNQHDTIAAEDNAANLVIRGINMFEFGGLFSADCVDWPYALEHCSGLIGQNLQRYFPPKSLLSTKKTFPIKRPFKR